MTGRVSVLSIVFFCLSALVSCTLPAGLFLWYRLKRRADVLPFFIGCAVMLVFSLILETLMHQLVFASPLGKVLSGSIPLYALYGGLAAGIFEETGRFVAFKTVLKRYRNRNVNALMYGAGHGGFEALAVVGSAMISNLVLAVIINTGSSALITGTLPADQAAQIESSLQALIDARPADFLWGIVERVFAVILQIALSVFVWFAAKKKNAWFFFPAAILVHFAVDAGVVLLRSGLKLPIAAVEGFFALFVCLTALGSYFLYKNGKANDGSAANGVLPDQPQPLTGADDAENAASETEEAPGSGAAESPGDTTA